MFGELILAASMSISPAPEASIAGGAPAFSGATQTTPFGGASIDRDRSKRDRGNRWNGGNQRGQSEAKSKSRSKSKHVKKSKSKTKHKHVKKSHKTKHKHVKKSYNRQVKRDFHRHHNRGVKKSVHKNIQKNINKSKTTIINKNVYKTKDRHHKHYRHGRGHGKHRHGYGKRHCSSYTYNNYYNNCRDWRSYNWGLWWNDRCDDDDYNFSINLNYGLTPYRTSYYSYSRPVVEYYPAPSTRHTSVYVTPGSAYDTSSYVYAAPSTDTDYRLYQQVIENERRLDDLERETPVTYVPVTPDYTTPVPTSASTTVKPDRPGPVVIEGDILEPAWRTLASGDPAVAQRMFALQAQSDEASSMDRVGFALAATELGDIRTAAWAMRRALDDNAASIGFLPSDSALRGLLDGFASKLADQHAKALSPEHAADIATVAAVVSALRLDDEGVKRWAAAAAEAGLDPAQAQRLADLAG